MDFKNWLEMTYYRDKLNPVPQHKVHHPEGSVYKHSKLVRKAMGGPNPSAIKPFYKKQNSVEEEIAFIEAQKTKALGILKASQLEPGSSLKNLNFNLDRRETNVLRIAGYLHDIGKITATTETPEKGIQAIGHETAEHYIPNLRELIAALKGTVWHGIWTNGDIQSKKELFFIITNHMSLRDEKGKTGFGRKRGNRFVDETGQYKNEPRIKLLLALVLMDRLGRGVPDPVGSALKAIGSIEDTAEDRVRRAQPGASGGLPSPDDPKEFLKSMIAKGKSPEVAALAFRNKFKELGLKPEDYS